MVSSSWGSYHPVRKISRKVALVCSTKTYVCKLLQQRIGIEVAPVCSTKTCVYKLLRQRIGIEASYITVHSMISWLLTLSSAPPPQTHVITKISYCDITNTYSLAYKEQFSISLGTVVT